MAKAKGIPPGAILGAEVQDVCRALYWVNDDGTVWAKDVAVVGNEVTLTLKMKGTDFGYWIAANCGHPYRRKPKGCVENAPGGGA